jgi:hypothetical protein
MDPSLMPDAPSDGQNYLRRNGAWVVAIDDGVFT